MRLHAAAAPLLLLPATALAQAPNLLGPFESPALPTAAANLTDAHLLSPRQGSNECAENYYNCAQAPGLCCPRTALCSADGAGAIACCPQGIKCTGTLGAPSATSGAATGTATRTDPGAIAAPPTGGAGSGFEQTSDASTSTVPNAFFPFPYIATTYTNAAACSSAYTRCQQDAARCETALADGGHGVTVQAPGGAGATITPAPSLGSQSASQVCSSLSSQACYGLQVEACQAFGEGSGSGAQGRCRGYGGVVGAGVAVGVAAGWF